MKLGRPPGGGEPLTDTVDRSCSGALKTLHLFKLVSEPDANKANPCRSHDDQFRLAAPSVQVFISTFVLKLGFSLQ